MNQTHNPSKSVERDRTLSDLIARLEKATGPDRELDGVIAIAVFKTIKTDDDLIYARTRDPGEDATHPGHYFIKSRSGAQAVSAPHYTSSIDAAMTLVPQGRAIRREYLPSASWPHRVWIYRDSFMPLDDGSRRPVLGKTEAIALAIASLKALEAQQ